jgi:hypothetical protein
MFDKSEQICASWRHRPSHLTLADAIQLGQQRLAMLVQIPMNDPLRVHPANLVLRELPVAEII